MSKYELSFWDTFFQKLPSRPFASAGALYVQRKALGPQGQLSELAQKSGLRPYRIYIPRKQHLPHGCGNREQLARALQ